MYPNLEWQLLEEEVQKLRKVRGIIPNGRGNLTSANLVTNIKKDTSVPNFRGIAGVITQLSGSSSQANDVRSGSQNNNE